MDFTDVTIHSPADATRQLWLAVADHHSLEDLAMLWDYQATMVASYCEDFGRVPALVVAATNYAMAVAQKQAGRSFVFVGLEAQVADLFESDKTWIDVQDAIEAIAQAWEQVGY